MNDGKQICRLKHLINFQIIFVEELRSFIEWCLLWYMRVFLLLYLVPLQLLLALEAQTAKVLLCDPLTLVVAQVLVLNKIHRLAFLDSVVEHRLDQVC